MQKSKLYDLVEALEYGTKLHVGVLLFGKYHREGLAMPFGATIHNSPVCNEMKERPRGLARCVLCRNAALQRALTQKRPFGGLCINGVFEYTHPVLVEGEVAAVIFIGNILPAAPAKLAHRLAAKPQLLDTLQRDCDTARCAAIATVLERYLLSLFASEESAPVGADPLFLHLKEYVDANLDYGVGVRELAMVFHYNEKYIGRLFKRMAGVSLCAYVNDRRIARAKQLLATKESVIAVAARVGFNNVTYFNRVFRAACGMTPSTYRRALRTGTGAHILSGEQGGGYA